MKWKNYLAILIVTLIVSSTFVNAASFKTNIKTINDYKEFTPVNIPLTDEDLQKLDEFVNSIKNEHQKKKAQEIIDFIITDNGEIDVKAIEIFAKDFFESANIKVGSPEFCKKCSEVID